MKRWIWIILVLIIIISIKLFFLTDGNARIKKDKKGDEKSNPKGVSGMVIKESPLENMIKSSGTLVPADQVELGPEIAGKVTGIYFQEGGNVRKGDLLIKLNDHDLQIRKKQLEADYQILIKKAERIEKLLKINGASQEEFEIARNNAESVGSEIEAIKSNIEKTEIRAPFNGCMGLKNVSEGAYLSPGMKAVMLTDKKNLKIDFSVPEKYSPFLKTGQKIICHTVGSEDSIPGKILAIEPMVDRSTRTITIRAGISNNQQNLLPGSFAHVYVSLENLPDAITIPTEALIPVLKGQKVFICRNGKAKEVIVETGIRNDRYVEIRKGLSPGDTIITSGIMSLREDAPVKLVKMVNK